MPPRATWKGFLNLSLVSVPVKAFSANDSGGTIRLNQLHADCNSRVNYKTVCPNCGEISRSDIVKGYEYAKDQYVVIDLEELEKLRPQDEGRAIRIAKFIPEDAIDPIYHSDTNYYLVPDGAAGQKPFALLRSAMEKADLVCVAQIVLHNKEQLVMVRPLGELLCMTVLRYASQIKEVDSFEEEVSAGEIGKDEITLAETLIAETTADSFDIHEYSDTYTERLTQLIEAKVEGKEIVAAPTVEMPPVINLMDALKASVAEVRGKSAGAGARKTRAKRKSDSSAPVKKKVAKRKRKSDTAKKSASPDTGDQLARTLSASAKKKKAATGTRKKKTG